MSSDEGKLGLDLPRVDQMPKRPPDKAEWDDVEVEIECSAMNITYAGCGSHRMNVKIEIQRRDLIEFLDKYQNERLEDAGNGR